MKSIIKSIILLCVLSVTLVSCETYDDPKADFSPVYPLSGEWRVKITNLNTNARIAEAMYTLGTYNTSENSSTQMWLRMTSNLPGGLGSMKVKINCDVPSLGFSVTDGDNLHVTTNAKLGTVSITEGKVTLNSVEMPSKVMSDRIFFKFTSSRVPGVTYAVEGYRRTRWNEDETVLDFK